MVRRTIPWLLTGLVLLATLLHSVGCKGSRKEEKLEVTSSLASGSVPLAWRERETTRLLDPKEAGWDTEVFAEQAGLQLNLLAALISGESEAWHTLPDLVAGDIRAGLLRTDEGETVIETTNLRVVRAGNVVSGLNSQSFELFMASKEILNRGA